MVLSNSHLQFTVCSYICILAMHNLKLSWTQSATSSITSSKSKVPQVNPMIRPAHDSEKQGTHAKPSGDLVSCDQTRNRSPDSSCALTRDKSRDLIRFGQARSPLINKWQIVGTVCNQQRHMTLVIVQYSTSDEGQLLLVRRTMTHCTVIAQSRLHYCL